MTTDSLARDARFRRYWAGQAVSEVGDRVSDLALPLIAITVLGAGPTTVGLLTAAIWAPNLLSLLVGSWVEQQVAKRRLMVLADAVRAVVIASLPIAWWLGGVTMTHLFVVALLCGLAQVVHQTAYPGLFVALVPRQRYIEANSLLSGTRSGSFIAGPALAGGLVQALTAPVAMLVDAVSFAVSAFLVGGVRVEDRPVDPAAGEISLGRRAWEGLRLVLRHPYLRASLACATTANFFNFMVAALLVLYASRHLGLSAGVIGLAFGIGAVGGLVGAVAARPVTRRLGVGRTIMLGAILFALPIAALPLAGGSTLSRAILLAGVEFVSGFGVMLFDVPLNALQTAVIPDDLRSRTSGAFATINYGIRPLGAALGGALGMWWGVEETLVLAAIGGMLAFLWLLPSPIRTTRTIEELGPVDVRVPVATT